MKKLKFLMDTDWLFQGVIDTEQKQYVLLGYFQKLNPQLEEMKIYPMFTEITLHLASIQNIIKHGKIIYIDKKLKSIDEELTLTDLKTKVIPNLTEPERTQLKEILKYSDTKLQYYFNIIKSIWTVVYDSIEVTSILNEDNLTSKKGYCNTKSNNFTKIWEYNIRKYKGTNKTTFTEITNPNILKHITSTENELPVFNIYFGKDFPLEETLFPLIKRKIMSYIFQSKNLTVI
jgi:hypothetical protein